MFSQKGKNNSEKKERHSEETFHSGRKFLPSRREGNLVKTCHFPVQISCRTKIKKKKEEEEEEEDHI